MFLLCQCKVLLDPVVNRRVCAGVRCCLVGCDFLCGFHRYGRVMLAFVIRPEVRPGEDQCYAENDPRIK